MPEGKTFYEIAAILGLATCFGIVGRKLHQPLIIMFLLTGILAGPSFLGIISSYGQIELLAQMGIALLLFIVGLKLDISLIKTTGPVALATGLGQIFFTSAIGLAIAIAMGIPFVSAAYIAVALTFSSTIIIVKLLSDKKEIDSLHGQIAIGFLIVQDIAAILALVALTTFSSTLEEGFVITDAVIIAVKGIGILAFAGLMMKFVLPPLVKKLATSFEVLILFSVSWAIFLGAGSEALGFSKEVGAFLAGVSLASTGYRDAIGARLSSLRDFLLLFFFIDLGAGLNLSSAGSQIMMSTVFSAFVLIGNPLIVLIIMGIMGYRRRTGFLAGLTVAQISEFSLIVAALGLSMGHISEEIMGVITLVGVITICISTYMIIFSGKLYSFLSEFLRIFEKKNPYRESEVNTVAAASSEMILAGLGNYGSALANNLLRRGRNFIGVDFDPGALRRWRSDGVCVLYGDISDPDIHELLPLNNAKWIVCTVRSMEMNSALLNHLKTSKYKGKIAMTASDKDEADILERMGTDIILKPYLDAAEQAADALTHAMEFLPDNVDWPISFVEVRVMPDSVIVGQTIRNIPLRSATGVSILAVSRTGKLHYEPGPDFQIYPGDRVIIMGPPDGLSSAEKIINATETNTTKDENSQFEIAEVCLKENSDIVGMTLADSGFRQKYGVTVIGIKRESKKITSVNPSEKIIDGDRIIVIGLSGQIQKLLNKTPL